MLSPASNRKRWLIEKAVYCAMDAHSTAHIVIACRYLLLGYEASSQHEKTVRDQRTNRPTILAVAKV